MQELIEMAAEMTERGMHVLILKDHLIVMNDREWNAYLNQMVGY